MSLVFTIIKIDRTSLIHFSNGHFPIAAHSDIVRSGEAALVDGNTDAIDRIDINDRWTDRHFRKAVTIGDLVLVDHGRIIGNGDLIFLAKRWLEHIEFIPGDRGP